MPQLNCLFVHNLDSENESEIEASSAGPAAPWPASFGHPSRFDSVGQTAFQRTGFLKGQRQAGNMYAYRKSMPRLNKHLDDKWVKHCQSLHKQKLQHMKAAIDNKPPPR